jgi:hypothetical protein
VVRVERRESEPRLSKGIDSVNGKRVADKKAGTVGGVRCERRISQKGFSGMRRGHVGDICHGGRCLSWGTLRPTTTCLLSPLNGSRLSAVNQAS